MPPGPPELEIVPELHRLPPRAADSHKGHFGRVLVVAGSRGMSGAAVLCASAALRSGAGLVTLASPQGVWPLVAVPNPCYLTMPLPEDEQGRFKGDAEPLLQLARNQDAIALGPGWGRSAALTDLVVTLLQRVETPLVLDADGLNALQGRTEGLRARTRPLILTPHPGEFARLLGTDIASVQARRAELAAQF